MLKHLQLNHVGPVHVLSADFADRLSVVTGDNGLGKSFLLDVCFWALTATWPQGRMALPDPGQKSTRLITYHISQKGKVAPKTATFEFDFPSQTWSRPDKSPVIEGLVLYAGVDGGFSVWDPARNHRRDGVAGNGPREEIPRSRFKAHPSWNRGAPGSRAHEEIPRAYQFTRESVASGLIEDEKTLCNGLIRDWVTWYYERSSVSRSNAFQYLEDVVALYCHPEESVACVEPRRVFVDDIRKFPTLRMPYGVVPFPQWPAGLRRVVSLAYLMVWAWVEHLLAVELRQEEPTKRLILIVDEVESHLHPKWQRTILPALLRVAETLRADLDVQIIVATHSPLVLASIEPHFDAKRDKLFWFDFQDGSVSFREYPWAIQGDVDGWLTSPIFGLKEARSREAEDVLGAAEAYMAGDISMRPEDLRTRKAIQKEMRRVLPGDDPIWARWLLKTQGGIPQ